MRALLSLIIPTYKGLHLLQTTLEKNLAQFSGIPGVECIIVDDCSDDGTVAWLETHFSEVITIVSSQNKGFAHTVNLGAVRATGEFLFFLNNDMQIMNLDLDLAFNVLREELVFALVPKIIRPSKDNAFESYTWGKFAGGWFSAESYLPNGVEGAIASSKIKPENRDPISRFAKNGIPILWACGGAMLVSHQKYEALGGFDTLYSPFYFEDLDLSYRAWKQGWESRYLDFAVVHHQHQATIGTLFSKAHVEEIHRTHHYLFMWKNVDDVGFLLSHVVTVLVKLLTFQVKDIRAIATAVLRFPEVWRYRRNRPRPRLKDRDILGRIWTGE
jgi:GT2 family glycosyltransferase